MKVGAGAAGALAAKVGSGINPTFGGPAGLAAVGYFMNNETLLTLAGMGLAQNFTGSMGGSGNTGGGWF